METYLKSKQVAQLLNVDVQTIRRWVKSGKLSAVRINSKLMLFKQSDVQKRLGLIDGDELAEDQKQQMTIAERIQNNKLFGLEIDGDELAEDQKLSLLNNLAGSK